MMEILRVNFSRVSSIAALGMALVGGGAFGQEKYLTDQLLGTWTLVSHESVRADGTRFPVYGPNPKGIALFDAGGHFIISVMRADRAKYAIDFPTQGTAEEYKDTAQGTMTYFGTYSVNQADRTIALHIEASSGTRSSSVQRASCQVLAQNGPPKASVVRSANEQDARLSANYLQ